MCSLSHWWIADFLQTKFSNTFSRMRISVIWLTFHWVVRFRRSKFWLAELPTRLDLSQCWLGSVTPCGVADLKELEKRSTASKYYVTQLIRRHHYKQLPLVTMACVLVTFSHVMAWRGHGSCDIMNSDGNIYPMKWFTQAHGSASGKVCTRNTPTEPYVVENLLYFLREQWFKETQHHLWLLII